MRRLLVSAAEMALEAPANAAIVSVTRCLALLIKKWPLL